MKKSLTVLGVVALVLAVAAGAGATAKALIPGSQLEDDSVTGAKIHDRTLHFVDLTSNAEGMIRQAWRLSVGKDKVKESMLDPALDAKINAATQSPPDTLAKGKTVLGVIESRARATSSSDTLWAGVTFRLPVSGSYASRVLDVNQKTTECAGTYAAPAAAAGNLCIYLGSNADNTANYLVSPVGALGFRLAWGVDKTGVSSVDATYAFTQS